MAEHGNGLRFGPLGDGALHLCVDMQDMFGQATAWHTPAMERLLPDVGRLVRRDPARRLFTRLERLRLRRIRSNSESRAVPSGWNRRSGSN